MHWRVAVAVMVAGAGALLPATVLAQAWPAPAGAGAVTMSTQTIQNTGHRLSDGSLLPEGKSRNVSALIDVDYALTERWSMALGLPYVFSRYSDTVDSLTRLPVDLCRCWHSQFQDWNATVRYNVVDGPVALTPSVSVGVPSHNYRWEGEAVVGFGLKELRLAVDGGLRLEALTPRLALLSRYQYAVVENIPELPDVANNRSTGSLALALAVSDRLSVRSGLSWQRTHGGVRLGGPGSTVPPDVPSDEAFRQHDRLLRDNYWHLGAGATYSLPRMDLFVSYLHFLSGTDTHAGRAFTAGVSVPFQR